MPPAVSMAPLATAKSADKYGFGINLGVRIIISA